MRPFREPEGAQVGSWLDASISLEETDGWSCYATVDNIEKLKKSDEVPTDWKRRKIASIFK